MKYLWIAMGGALGSLARYGLGEWIQHRFPSRFPMGTFVINLTGCLAIGFVIAILDARLPGPSVWLYAIPIGFIGAYTTFSTFELETYRAMHAEWFIIAGAYILGSVVLGLFGVWVGSHLGAFLVRVFD
jgi:CrcB protein